MKKKILVLMSVLTFVTSTGCNAEESVASSNPSNLEDKVKAAAINFKDITGHWAKGTIEKAIEKGYVDGYEDGTFRADTNVSRAEFIKMVVTALKEPLNGNSSGTDWATRYISAAKNKGILLDSDFPLDKINEPITRLEMSRIAVRSTKKELQNPDMHMDDNSFMYNATKTGLIQGLAGGELGVDKSTTRAQSVTIIERVLTVNDGGKLEVDKYAVGNAELALKKTNIFSMIPIFGGKQNTDEHFNLTPYSPSKLVMETPDGKYKGAIDQIIVIDTSDPNDPNWSAAGDISNLKWWAGGMEKLNPNLYIKYFPDSYLIVIKSHVEYSKDNKSYGENYAPQLSFYGFESPDKDALINGTLNTLGSVYVKRPGDSGMFILPKSGYGTNGSMGIKLRAPAIPPQSDYGRTIVDIMVPKSN